MKCYNTIKNGYKFDCENDVDEEYTFCASCKQRNYPHHKQTALEKPREFKFKALTSTQVSNSNSSEIPNKSETEDKKTSLFDLSFEQLKTLEKKASEWLSENKHLEKSEPERWAKAMAKYRRIVKFLNLKTS